MENTDDSPSQHSNQKDSKNNNKLNKDLQLVWNLDKLSFSDQPKKIYKSPKNQKKVKYEDETNKSEEDNVLATAQREFEGWNQTMPADLYQIDEYNSEEFKSKQQIEEEEDDFNSHISFKSKHKKNVLKKKE